MAVLGVDILADIRAQKRGLGTRRIFALIAVFLLFAALGLHTLRLGFHGQERLRRTAESGAKKDRADIVDRNGEILAKNIYAFDLFLDARKIKDSDRAANFVHSVAPEISAAEVIAKIETGKRNIEIKKDIGRDVEAAVKNEKIDGISAVLKQVRKYPKNNLMSHVVGFVNRDGRGADGVEKSEDERLRAIGEPLVLSIDSRIQSEMRTQLGAAIKEYGTKAALGILMNARTGEILAMVSLPDFDPENIGGFPRENLTSKIRFHNYEMGSIFKIFTTALALSHGMPVESTFNVADPFIISGRPVAEARGFKPPAKNLNLEQIMQYSSNSGSAQIALALPDGAQIEFFKELYFNRPLETDFGMTAGTIFPKSFTPTDRSRWAFGQGISVTPLHALLAANAIVNDGKYIMPTIYKRDFVPAVRQVVSKEVSKKLRGIMLKVMDTSGRAAAVQIHFIKVGGKTSTAQKSIGGKYSDTKNITAFFSTFPIEAPKWSMLIILDEPEGNPRTAAYNAVPVSGKIIDAVAPLLN